MKITSVFSVVLLCLLWFPLLYSQTARGRCATVSSLPPEAPQADGEENQTKGQQHAHGG